MAECIDNILNFIYPGWLFLLTEFRGKYMLIFYLQCVCNSEHNRIILVPILSMHYEDTELDSISMSCLKTPHHVAQFPSFGACQRVCTSETDSGTGL